MKKKLNGKRKERNESSDSEDLDTLSLRRREVTKNDQENSVKRTESTDSFETSDKDLYEPENAKKKTCASEVNQGSALSALFFFLHSSISLSRSPFSLSLSLSLLFSFVSLLENSIFCCRYVGIRVQS